MLQYPNIEKTQNSNCDTTQKLKLGHYSKTQIVTNKIFIVREKKSNQIAANQILTKFKNSNCDKTLKLKLQQNSKTLIVKNITISNCEKTQIATKLKN